jgi:hypothetical protein
MMFNSGKWEPWTNYTAYQSAELAACGLVNGGAARQAAHNLEIRADDGRIVASVTSEPAPGWPHGKAVVKRV